MTSLVGSGFNPLAIPFALWSVVPYALLWLAGPLLRSPWAAGGGGLAAIAADLGIRASVFVWPSGSTAALALIFSPVFIAVIVMPLGAAAGWVCGTLWRRSWPGRVIALSISPIVLALTVLGFARPELIIERLWLS